MIRPWFFSLLKRFFVASLQIVICCEKKGELSKFAGLFLTQWQKTIGKL